MAIDERLSLFPTELGWCGMVGGHNRLTALTFGHATPGEVHERLLADGRIERLSEPVDWWPKLRQRVQAYARGDRVVFEDVSVVHLPYTQFQRRVIEALRRVDYGETVSYGELAARAGSPAAARAVGRVMATNRLPLIIPCHRVLASGDRLGGYSAPSGLVMKQRLLALEGVDRFQPAAT